jgi:type I restriction enzyme M protein
MAVKKSELYSSLWASCDSLRGGMDSSFSDENISRIIKWSNDLFGQEVNPQ